jgi:hypothetical protein
VAPAWSGAVRTHANSFDHVDASRCLRL